MSVAVEQYPSMELAECPFPFYERVLADAPVYQVPGRPDEYVVSRHEDVMFVLRNPDLFSNSGRPSEEGAGFDDVPSMAISTDPPQHTIQRELIRKPFTPGRLKAKVPMLREMADRLIDEFIDGGECDFATAYANPYPIYVTCDLLGLPERDFEKIRTWGELEGFGTKYRDAEEQARQHANGVMMAEYLSQTITERYASPGDDALSEIILGQVERDGRFDLPYLIAEAGLVLSGGIVTSAHAIANAMMLLLQNPDQMAAVQADRSKISRMFEEALRVESPVQWQARRCTQDVEIAGVRIPEGAAVIWAIGAADRDPRLFDCSAHFDIDRKNVKDHIAFGYGIHFCFGAPLARLEAQITFERMFDRLKNIRLSSKQGDFRCIDSILFRGPREVWIEFDRA